MELGASIILFAAASLLAISAYYLWQTDRMPWRSKKLVLGEKLPKIGKAGSITEAQSHKLIEQGVVTPYQTWLSTEQASLLLECSAYVEAIWSRRMNHTTSLPKDARRAGLKIVLGHDSYREEAKVWVEYEARDAEPPLDFCAHQLIPVLSQWAPRSADETVRPDPVSA